MAGDPEEARKRYILKEMHRLMTKAKEAKEQYDKCQSEFFDLMEEAGINLENNPRLDDWLEEVQRQRALQPKVPEMLAFEVEIQGAIEYHLDKACEAISILEFGGRPTLDFEAYAPDHHDDDTIAVYTYKVEYNYKKKGEEFLIIRKMEHREREPEDSTDPEPPARQHDMSLMARCL
jgi:hypothetical protein